MTTCTRGGAVYPVTYTPQTRQLRQWQPHSRRPSPRTMVRGSPLRYPERIYDGNQSRYPQQQHEFDENRHLPAQQSHPARIQQSTFHCGVCLETYAVDDIARVDPCTHAFCRECIKSYVSSKLKERHFPIFCPTCMTEESPQYPSGGLAPSRFGS